MTLDLIPGPVLSALSAWILLFVPGRALLGRSESVLPPVLARVLASAVATTLVGTALAAVGSFSLPNLLLCNAAIAIVALVLRRLAASPAAKPPESPRRDLVGGLIVTVALLAYWPAYPVFLGASDSTAYVGSGISLAHHGSLARDDDLGPTLPLAQRRLLFDSMSQVFGSGGPPYRRMPGAMLIESLDATTAFPCFFPVPSVWAAVMVLLDATGGAAAEQAAPNFAPLFGALALWCFWQIARRWLGTAASLAAVALLGISGPFFAASRTAMSEPIAAFFVLGGLAILQAGAANLRRSDAVLAGAALGAAVFTRVEIALLIAMTAAIAPSLAGRDRSSTRWPLAFVVPFVAVASATIAQAAALPGTWILPFHDHVQNAWIGYGLKYGRPSPGSVVAVATAVSAATLFVARRIGWSATIRWGFVAAVVVGHATASRWLVERTPMWMSFYVGWPGLALAAAGAAIAAAGRQRPAGAPVLVGLAAATALVLFYNPHVYPSLPWGARRFAPVLLPMTVLLACYASASIAARSRLLAAACFAALAVGVGLGGRPYWGEPLLEGTWEQLAEIDAAVPEDGTILVERPLSSLMIGPSLWLIHDRNSLTIPPTDTKVSRDTLPGLVWFLTERGPVYLVSKGTGTPLPTPRVNRKRLARAATSLRYLEGTYDRRPRRIERTVTPLTVWKLERSLDARGTVR